MRRTVLFLALVAGAARADVQEGNWELTLTASVEGMPGNMAPMTQTKCITREDARDPSRLIGAGAGCQFSNKRDTGSEITFDIVCTGQVPMSGSGTVRYSAQSFDGTMQITADMGSQKVMTRSQVVGRRLGGC